MKIQIRKNVFETNSSSVHSLAISRDGLEPSRLLKDKNNKIVTDFGSFGKDLCLYGSQEEKLSYLITCLAYMSNDFGSAEGVYNNYLFEDVEDAICEYAGVDGIKILGYVEPEIDHQSIPNDSGDMIINICDEDEIVNFVFNKHISLKTDCD